jgi:tellurite methyltransferase
MDTSSRSHSHTSSRPSSWLLENADLLTSVPGRRALDVACGRGRHAFWLAAAGFTVHATDRDEEAIGFVNSEARRLGVPVTGEVRDIEAHGVSFGHEAYDVIVVVHYLHRPLFPALVSALCPHGLLFYETFTVDQAQRGKPSNPDYLLLHGELERLVAPLDVLRSRDGEFEDRLVAGVVALKRLERARDLGGGHSEV